MGLEHAPPKSPTAAILPATAFVFAAVALAKDRAAITNDTFGQRVTPCSEIVQAVPIQVRPGACQPTDGRAQKCGFEPWRLPLQLGVCRDLQWPDAHGTTRFTSVEKCLKHTGKY